MPTPLKLFPSENETIEGVGKALRAGKTSCAAVLEHCFHQIDLWDERVHAWVIVDRAGAMHQARALDAELAEGKCRGPLHGIPLGIKDIIDVQGLPTAAGFRPWRERVATSDAAIVAKLRLAGAVILGKTVTTQFAWVDPPLTRNPWNLECTPGGSSSGSAAAVATGMCLGAIGTQTGGSIIRPASFCGVAGFKPQHWFVPSVGILPFAPSLDHFGPIARTVGDLSLIYQRMFHESDDYPPFDEGRLPPFEIAEIESAVADLGNEQTLPAQPTLYRPRGFFDRRADVEMLEAFEAALKTLNDAGAIIVDLAEETFDFEAILREHRTLMACEAAAVHEATFAAHREDYAPHIRALIEEGLASPVTRYVRSAFEWRKPINAYSKFVSEQIGLESVGAYAIVTPATIGPAPDLSTTGNPCFNSPFSYFGSPALSFPIGLSARRLPLAIQLVGLPYLAPFAIASWCEFAIRDAAQKGDQ